MEITAPTLENLILNLSHEVTVRASLEATFDSLLEQMGPASENGEGKPMPMVLEAWPGGRWFRDLGEGNGHFWGHVQAIKRPTLLEITGPLFMSHPVVSNMQYRLKELNGGTLSRSVTPRSDSSLTISRRTSCAAGRRSSSACASRRKRVGRE